MSEDDPINSALSLARQEEAKYGYRTALPLTEDQRKIVDLGQQVDRLRSEISAATKLFEAEQIKKSRLISDHQKEVKDLTEALATSREEAANSAALMLERVDEVARLKAEIESLKLQHDAVTKYERAAKFWGKKSNRHTASGVIALLGFIVLGGFFVKFGVDNYQEIISALPKSSTGEVGISAIALFFILSLPLLWTLRLLAKFTMEHFNLTQDADERRTMMETFLSLLGNPEAKVQGEERLLVLRSVFRPASSTKDDGGPLTLLDTVKSMTDSMKTK